MAEAPVIRVEDVHFAYDSRVPVLTGVDLTVGRGEYVAMVGPNGGGKTTLLKVLLGLLTPGQGRVAVLGRAPAEARGRVGYVPQHVSLQPGLPLTVTELVLMGLPRRRQWGMGWGAEDRARAAAAMDQVGIADLAGRRFDGLSGGQRQRALIARALVVAPELVLFDEPTANVDPQGRHCLYELFEELRDRLTVVLVSHDLAVTAPAVTQVVVVNGTAIAHHGRDLTPDMLRLIYGSHESGCPMGSYIQQVCDRMAAHG